MLNDPRFASGHEYETRKTIIPKTYHFGDYLFVTGFPNDSGISSLGLLYKGTEICYETTRDGFYDTIILANLNNDRIPDFLISVGYEDGATLNGLISHSTIKFSYIKLLDEWQERYCPESGDTLQHILPLQIKDIDGDGSDDIIVNLVQILERRFAISCTDTVFASTLKYNSKNRNAP
jgi:hypothetical protein